MYDPAEAARLLDILGNRNRRRILELLRQKPCFVTEISDTLMLSPKAVIEHLQLMEREAILACQTDERRRKYYYLAQDILVSVSVKQAAWGKAAGESRQAENIQLRKSVAMLGQMIRSHDQMLSNLEQISHDIEIKLTDLARNNKDLFRSEREISVMLVLAHDPMSLTDLEEVIRTPRENLLDILKRFERAGVVNRVKDHYILRGVHAE